MSLENPYTSPAVEEALPPDPLYWPAVITNVFAAVVGAMAIACFGFVAFAAWCALAYDDWDVGPTWQAADQGGRFLVFACIAGAAAWCMQKRRYRWFLVLACIAGLITCVPGPIAAIVLLRMRQPAVWHSFK